MWELPNASTGVVTGKVTGTDKDRDALQFAAPASTSNGAVTLNAAHDRPPTRRQLQRVMPRPQLGRQAAAKADTFAVTVTDGHGGVVTKTITVSIAAKNSAPTVAGTPTVGAADAVTGTVDGSLGAARCRRRSIVLHSSSGKGNRNLRQRGQFSLYPDSGSARRRRHAECAELRQADTFTVTVSDEHRGNR